MLSSICAMCIVYGNSSPPTTPRHCFTLLLCQLDNCNALVCGLPQNRAQKQYKLYCKNCIEQEKVRARYSYPHSSAFNFVSNPTIKQLTVFKVLVTSHKALNGLARGFNTDPMGQICAYQISAISSDLLKVPRAHTVSYGDRGFGVAALKFWNSIPYEIRTPIQKT